MTWFMSLKSNTPVPFWRCLAYNIAIAIWTVLSGGVLAPMAVFSKRWADKITPLWTTGALWLAKHICGQTFEIRGQEHIMYQEFIMVCKHQSAFEIIILLNQFPTARFVIKKELLWLPVFGQYLWRIGMVPIDRGDTGNVMEKMMDKARRLVINQRRPLIIFPEGTRAPAGEKTKYQPGYAVMYDQFKLPISPVAINTGVYWPKSRWKKTAGCSVIEFLPVIEPGLSMRQCLKQVKTSIETKSAELYEEAIGQIEEAGSN